MRVEVCTSLSEARARVAEVEGEAHFDNRIDRVAIYQGGSWITAKVLEE